MLRPELAASSLVYYEPESLERWIPAQWAQVPATYSVESGWGCLGHGAASIV